MDCDEGDTAGREIRDEAPVDPAVSTERADVDGPAFQPDPAPTGRGGLLLHALQILGLLYVFLLSIKLIGSAFGLFGSEFSEALVRNCQNPVVGLFIGIFVTSLVQSSSSTTSLTVGFVAGGVLPLEFAIPIIMGANIGTTITNIIVSFGFVARREDFRRAFAGATVHDFFNLCSVLLLFPIETRFHIIEKLAVRLTGVFDSAGGVKFTSPIALIIKPVAGAIKSFFLHTLNMPDLAAGIVLICLSTLALIASLIFLVRVLRGVFLKKAERLINRYLFRNDLTALVLGIFITASVQSSSVTTSLVVPLVGAGVLSLYRCYPFTLGANIGTTVTALLASMATVGGGAGNIGVTAAFAHLIFNVLGIAVFYPLRIIPITMATNLARVAARSKRWAILFVLLVFFGVPLLVITVAKHLLYQ